MMREKFSPSRELEGHFSPSAGGRGKILPLAGARGHFSPSAGGRGKMRRIEDEREN